jgi:ferredoxin-NADP reductase
VTDIPLLPTAALAPQGGWRRATVRELLRPGARAVVLRLEVGDRIAHVPGQHYVVRLTADDGYTASRSYSVASAPSDPLVELYVERLDDGEVSSFLADVLEVGDELEVRGPIGGWFAWDGTTPALAIGGGTGVVPLVSMLRHARYLGHPDRICLVAAGRTVAELPYAEEIGAGCDVLALSREESPTGRRAARLGPDDVAPHLREGQVHFVCGSAAFAESASRLLVDLGVETTAIRVERFGPSG